MDINYQAAQFYLNSANILLTLGIGLYAFISNRHKATNNALAAQAQRLERLEYALSEHQPGDLRQDIHRLENRMGQLTVSVNSHRPHEEDIQRVHARIDRLAESVSQMQGQLGQINANVSLISEYLLKSK